MQLQSIRYTFELYFSWIQINSYHPGEHFHLHHDAFYTGMNESVRRTSHLLLGSQIYITKCSYPSRFLRNRSWIQGSGSMNVSFPWCCTSQQSLSQPHYVGFHCTRTILFYFLFFWFLFIVFFTTGPRRRSKRPGGHSYVLRESLNLFRSL